MVMSVCIYFIYFTLFLQCSEACTFIILMKLWASKGVLQQLPRSTSDGGIINPILHMRKPWRQRHLAKWQLVTHEWEVISPHLQSWSFLASDIALAWNKWSSQQKESPLHLPSHRLHAQNSSSWAQNSRILFPYVLRGPSGNSSSNFLPLSSGVNNPIKLSRKPVNPQGIQAEERVLRRANWEPFP